MWHKIGSVVEPLHMHHHKVAYAIILLHHILVLLYVTIMPHLYYYTTVVILLHHATIKLYHYRYFTTSYVSMSTLVQQYYYIWFMNFIWKLPQYSNNSTSWLVFTLMYYSINSLHHQCSHITILVHQYHYTFFWS